MFFEDWARELLIVSGGLALAALLTSALSLVMRRGHMCDPVAELFGHVTHSFAMVYMALGMGGVIRMIDMRIGMLFFVLSALYFFWRGVERGLDGMHGSMWRDLTHAASCAAMAYMFVDVRQWVWWLTAAAVLWCAYVFANTVGRTVTLATVTHVRVNRSLVFESAAHVSMALAMISMFVVMHSAQATALVNGPICGMPM